jgi:hypothetical protein
MPSSGQKAGGEIIPRKTHIEEQIILACAKPKLDEL